MAITFNFDSVGQCTASINLDAAVPVGAGTITAANIVAAAPPGSPLSEFASRTNLTRADVWEFCSGVMAPLDISNWGFDFDVNAGAMEINFTADTDATSAQFDLQFKHSTVR